MKSYKNVLQEICAVENLEDSFDQIIRGSRKETKSGKKLIKCRDNVIAELKQQIESGEYRVSSYKTFQLVEGGKIRDIQSIPLKDRIALNAIMKIVERYLNKRFVLDTASSIQGRGTHYLLKRIVKDRNSNREGTKYIYKCDVKKFYQSIDQDLMIMIIRKLFKEEKLLNILESFIRFLPKGLSIGLRSSQSFGNLYLDYFLDHIIKDECGIKYYKRYCDDIMIMTDSYEKLYLYREVIHNCIKNAKLELKSNEQIYCIEDRPIDFLGFKIYSDGKIQLRKHIKQRFARRWKRIKSIKRKTEIIGSFYGIAKHANAKHLFKRITNISMKDFKDFGIKYQSFDGKKNFDCQTYQLADLTNMSIIVLDYETGITTKIGDGRYLVHFELDGKEGKFITNSKELKYVLDEVSKEDGNFPFRATIKRVSIGNNKYKYSFS